jgi:hypothetical protein
MDSLALPENWLEITRARTLRMVEEIRGGRVEIIPADRDSCRFCDAKDICRIEVGGVATEAEAHERSILHSRSARCHRCGQAPSRCLRCGRPGSGKTTVLVEYFSQLVGAGTIRRILAIITEKAAATCASWRRPSSSSPRHAPNWSALRLTVHASARDCCGERRIRRRRPGVPRA